MSQNQVVEKITHLQCQINRLKSFDFTIQQTTALAKFYKARINRYQNALTS